MRLQIRPMKPEEIDLALDWAAAEGWNPGLHDAAPFRSAERLPSNARQASSSSPCRCSVIARNICRPTIFSSYPSTSDMPPWSKPCRCIIAIPSTAY